MIRFGLLEIDQEAQAQVGGPRIIEALGGVLVGETIHTLQLQHQYVLNEDVGKILPNMMTLVGKSQRGLGSSPDATEVEFARQGMLVDVLQESGAQYTLR